MTVTDPIPADPWQEELAQLKSRYTTASPAILAAMCILLRDANISMADAKAQAELRGVRITAASLASARVLLSRVDSPSLPALAPAPFVDAKQIPRRPRPAAPVDAEALVRNFVEKLQTQRDTDTERLRDAIRKAIAVLQAAVG